MSRLRRVCNWLGVAVISAHTSWRNLASAGLTLAPAPTLALLTGGGPALGGSKVLSPLLTLSLTPVLILNLS